MRGPPSAQESQQLEELMLAVEELRRRVAALERAVVPTASGAAADMSGPVSNFVAAPLPSVSSGLVPAVGRLLLGIAGAYLLRAIAEARVLPELAGTTLGLIYAGAWLVWSVRIPRGRRLSAAFEAITASGIVAPLLWEATVRFHTLSPFASAAALSLFVILGQMVAWRRDHSALAGITALTGSATAIALIMATHDPMPFSIALAAAAAVIEYGAFRDRALVWRWIVAVTVDLCAFLLVYLAGRPQGLPEGYAPIPMPGLMALLIGLAVIYLSSTAARTAFRGIPMVWFEVLQVPAILALAVGGVLRISHGSGAAVMLAGSACLTLSAACYGAAFARVREFAVPELPGLRHLRTAARLHRGSFAALRATSRGTLVDAGCGSRRLCKPAAGKYTCHTRGLLSAGCGGRFRIAAVHSASIDWNEPRVTPDQRRATLLDRCRPLLRTDSTFSKTKSGKLDRSCSAGVFGRHAVLEHCRTIRRIPGALQFRSTVFEHHSYRTDFGARDPAGLGWTEVGSRRNGVAGFSVDAFWRGETSGGRFPTGPPGHTVSVLARLWRHVDRVAPSAQKKRAVSLSDSPPPQIVPAEAD